MSKHNCNSCGRQIVSYPADNDKCVGGEPIIKDVNGYICHKCGKELDENGNFPEEVR